MQYKICTQTCIIINDQAKTSKKIITVQIALMGIPEPFLTLVRNVHKPLHIALLKILGLSVLSILPLVLPRGYPPI